MKLRDIWTVSYCALGLFFGVGNCLPAAVHVADNLYSFRHELNTHLFTLCLMTDYLFFQTFVMHSRSGAE